MNSAEKGKRLSLRKLFGRRTSSTKEVAPLASLSPLDVVGQGLDPWDGCTKGNFEKWKMSHYVSGGDYITGRPRDYSEERYFAEKGKRLADPFDEARRLVRLRADRTGQPPGVPDALLLINAIEASVMPNRTDDQEVADRLRKWVKENSPKE